jgi:hypothetical protein
LVLVGWLLVVVGLSWFLIFDLISSLDPFHPGSAVPLVLQNDFNYLILNFNYF